MDTKDRNAGITVTALKNTTAFWLNKDLSLRKIYAIARSWPKLDMETQEDE